MANALEALMNPHSAQCQEYFLQGSVRLEHVAKVLSILRGICDNSEDDHETFIDHEVRYRGWGYDRGRYSPFSVRVIRSLDREEEPYLLSYVGLPQPHIQGQPTAMRARIDVRVTSTITEFLQYSGFEKSTEIVTSGYQYKKGRMKITVARIQRPDSTTLVGIRPIPGSKVVYCFVTDSYLVEVSVLETSAVAPHLRTAIGMEVRRIADMLKPIVDMAIPQ